MVLTDVKSSQIAKIGYDKETKELEIHFTSGGQYVYAGFPEAKFTEFLGADSFGSWFHRNVRGLYPFRRKNGR